VHDVIHPLSHFTRGDLALAGSEDWLSKSGGEWTQFPKNPQILGSGEAHVLFMGDSNMQQYFPRIQKIFADRKVASNHAVMFVTRFGCVPVAETALDPNDPDLSGCRRYVHDVIRYAERPEISTVVIAGCWYGEFSDWSYYFDHGDRAPLRESTDSELKGLKELVARLVRSGKRVYLVLNIPVGKGLDPRARAYWFGETPSALNRREMVETLEPIDSKIRGIANEVGASVIDPLLYLCDGTQCPVIAEDGTSMYHDMWHLRPSYVRERVGYLDEILEVR
jgi:SGNH domain (fused to AT3 domains)